MYNYRHLLPVIKKNTVRPAIKANKESGTTGEKDRNKNLSKEISKGDLARTYYFRCDERSSFLLCLHACSPKLHAEKYRVGHIS